LTLCAIGDDDGSRMIGTTTSLRPSGFGRHVVAAFLGLWLCGWLLGEVLVATALVTVLSSMAGLPFDWLPNWGRNLRESSGAMVAIPFMLLWLTLWTVGGLAALTAFVRSIAGEDAIALTPLGFELVRRAGPFRRRHAFERAAIRRIRIRPHDRALVVDSETGTREVSTFGSPEEREQTAAWLNHQLQLPDNDSAAGVPSTWDVRIEGDVAQVRKVKPSARLIRSVIAWIVTGTMAAAWVNSSNQDGTSGPILLGMAVAVGLGAVFSTWGRRDWIVRPGEMIFRRRLATWGDEQTFRNARLEVTRKTDSDNDSHYSLVVADGEAQRTVHTQMNDSREVDDLGHWLAARTGFPFTPS
jgi:hypothetical protein